MAACALVAIAPPAWAVGISPGHGHGIPVQPIHFVYVVLGAAAFFGGAAWVGWRRMLANEAGVDMAQALDVTHSDSLAELTSRAAARDAAWREADVRQQAEDAFMAVQRAWLARDADLATDVMTEALHARRNRLSEAMRQRGERSMRDQFTLKSAHIVHVADHLDDNRDEMWVKFVATAIDYTLGEHGTEPINGSKSDLRFFAETWGFKRRGDAWLADAIMGANASVPTSFVET